MSDKLGFEVTLNLPLDEAIDKVTAALKEEGFGVLTRIDVHTTLKKKIDVDFRPYVILGACNPKLAHSALEANAEIGLLLPCNVTVESDGKGGSIVRIVNPEMMLSAAKGSTDAEALQKIADEATAKLKKVAESLK